MSGTSNFSAEHYRSVLEELGYPLVDRGHFWQTKALFRGGDNMTAIQIFKDSGVWRDFVEDTPPSPFFKLLQAHFNTKDNKVIGRFLQGEYLSTNKEAEPTEKKVTMPTVFEKSLLEDLLPHYKFYNNKGIDSEILKNLHSGMDTKGKMVNRFVFPVYNEHDQIIGFAGRDMANRNPKWKLIGRKTSWLYPYYVPDVESEGYFPTQEAIEKAKSVIIVESIGDLLNLRQNGFYNVLVCFGLDISPLLVCHLLGLNTEKVIIAFNNDADETDSKSKNRGAYGAVKNYLKLLKHLTPDHLSICLPVKNDFGDMSKEDFTLWKEKLSTQGPELASKVLSFAEAMAKNGDLSGQPLKNLKLLRSYVS